MVGGGGEWSRLRQHDELMESGQGGGHGEAGLGSGEDSGGCMLQGLVTCVHRFVQLTSLADKLALHYPVLGLVIANPQSTALLVLGVYGVLLLLWFPLFLLSLAISSTGVYVLLGGSLYMAGRVLARTLSYPGNVPTVLRDIEVEYAAQMVRKLDHCALKIKEWVADLRVVVNTTVPTPHPLLSRHHLEVCFLRKHTVGVLLEALQSLVGSPERIAEMRLSESAVRDGRSLVEVLERVVTSLDAAMPVAQRVLAIHAHHTGSHRFSFSGSLDMAMSPAASMPHPSSYSQNYGAASSSVAALDAAAEAAEQLKRTATLFRRDRPNDEAGCLGVLRHWLRARRPWDNVLGSGLMREELCKRMRAKQVWITMDDGARLDCCFIPAQRTCSSTGKSVGTVLYCNPNAGHYECATHAPFSSDWVDLYTSLGCDVMLFNYRGYGRSTGSPSPSVVMRDAECLVRFMHKELGCERIGVHGESIGGMVACHVARHCEGVELLIADRTFATLSGVADRLMFPWAGTALHFFTGWSETDVVSDFLGASCHKVVCCDPNDAIITDTASLKVGVAVRLELGDRRHSRLSVPRSYLIAEALDASPCASAQVPSLPTSPHARLSEASLLHFAACLRFLSRRARGLDCQAGLSRTPSRGVLAQELAARLASGHLAFEEESEMSEVDGDSEDESMASSSGWTSPSAGPLQQVWRTLSRCDGLCGVMLGQAVNKDYEAVRAWVCCLLHWGPGQCLFSSSGNMQRDFPATLTIQVVRLAIEETLERRSGELKGLAEQHDLEYVTKMIAYLDDRLTHETQELADQQEQAVSPPCSTSTSTSTRATPGGNGCSSAGAHACSRSEGGRAKGSSSPGRGFGEEAVVIGELLPLACGHNASFSEVERERLIHHLSSQGWVLETQLDHA